MGPEELSANGFLFGFCYMCFICSSVAMDAKRLKKPSSANERMSAVFRCTF